MNKTGNGHPGERLITVYSKQFSYKPSEMGRVMVHGDYPMITAEDIRTFARFCMNRTKPVVSGCPAEIHPYRLIVETEEGFIRPYYDVPQSVRGNRHLYPVVFQVLPALLYVPPGTGPEMLLKGCAPYIYAMEKRKLLDRTLFPDVLFLEKELAMPKQDCDVLMKSLTGSW
jgi:hypothetical protein